MPLQRKNIFQHIGSIYKFNLKYVDPYIWLTWRSPGPLERVQESTGLDKITRVNMLHPNGATGWQRVIIDEPCVIPANKRSPWEWKIECFSTVTWIISYQMIAGNTLYSTPVEGRIPLNQACFHRNSISMGISFVPLYHSEFIAMLSWNIQHYLKK